MITVDGVDVWLASPDGSRVNFTNPQRDIATVTASYCAFGIAITVPVILGPSLYAAYYIRREWHIEHYTIILASILTLASGILTFICLHKGVLGVHVWEMSMDDAIWKKKLILVTILLGILGTALARLGLCAFYGRIAELLWYRRVINGTVVLIIIPSIVVWFGLLFACRPVEAAWNLRMSTEAHCMDSYPLHILHAIVGGLADLILTLVAVYTTHHLQMPRMRKTVLLAYFSTGLLTLATAAARLSILIRGIENPDKTFVLALGTVCLALETSFVIIFGSLPNFYKFIKYFVLKVFEKSQSLIDCGIDCGQGSGSEALVLRTTGGSCMNGVEPPSENSRYHRSSDALIVP